METEKVLVTGGCGFVGAHLSRRLLELGKEVTVLDTSVPRQPPINSLKIVEGDIRDSELVEKLMSGVKTVYHLAGVTEFDDCRVDPLRAHQVNVHGTETILQKAVMKRVASVVSFSSSSVYADDGKFVKREDMVPAPSSDYGITKLLGEELCRRAHLRDGIPCIVLRPFNIYGEQGRGVINIFSKALKEDGRITIYGDGSQARDYVHVDDVVRAAIALGEAGLSGIYNIGTGVRCELLELKGIMEQISGTTFTIEWQPPRPWDLQEIIADDRRIKEILPTTVPLVDGLTALLKKQGTGQGRGNKLR
jgi:UDP-glucose 4-epimerase